MASSPKPDDETTSSEGSSVDSDDFLEVMSSKSKRRKHSAGGVQQKKMKQTTETENPSKSASPVAVNCGKPSTKSASPVAGPSGQPSFNINPYSDCIVFIKGVNNNIGRFATQNPISFKRAIINAIGEVRSIKVKDDHIILTCQNPTQRTGALQLADINGQPVKVSPPSSNPRKLQTHSVEKQSKGIIFGVSLSLTDDDIITETTSTSVRRLTKLINGKRENTETVVLTFSNPQLPEYVNIGFLKYRVKPYIPLPFRCTKCQKFGHSHNTCNGGVVCPRCSGNHSFAECTKKDQPKCSNCHGDHSAAWSGCPKYVQIQHSLKVSVTEKISFRDALLKIKSSVPQPGKPIPVSVVQNPENKTSSKPQKTPVVNPVANKAPTSSKTPSSSTENEKKIIDLEDKLSKITDLLRYSIVGILITLDNINQDPEEGSGLHDYKRTLSLYAASCGIDVCEIYQNL